MTLYEPYPDLDELFASISEVGLRLSTIAASEGAAGNISLALGWPLEVRRRFPQVRKFSLPEPVPALMGKQILVTGSGRRLHDIHLDSVANLGVVSIAADGQHAHLYTSPRCLFDRVTSEFNSHLAVHAEEARHPSKTAQCRQFGDTQLDRGRSRKQALETGLG
jgi:rhamnulose-1-phosphate aldolase